MPPPQCRPAHAVSPWKPPAMPGAGSLPAKLAADRALPAPAFHL
jgi:hypothetical protein